MKLNGGIFLLRIELERERGLTDPEWRLWLAYRSLCGWDRTKGSFGIADITIAGLQKYLDWSTGKICSTRQTLIGKGKLEKIQGSKYRLVDAEQLFRPRFRQSEIGVQGIERAIQYVERKGTGYGFKHPQKNVENRGFSAPAFQPVESTNTPKEIIKKPKELRGEKFALKGEEKDGEIPIWHDPDEVRRFRESLKDKKPDNNRDVL